MDDGFLNIRKPSGFSSFDVVSVVRKTVLAEFRTEKRLKFGHAGTLDPLADGVLVVAVGRATKLISYVQNQKKTYLATFQLGVESDSEDTETELRAVENGAIPTFEAIQAVLPAFTGTILQRPPAYSAVKINGQRAYKLARQGRTVPIAEREIVVESLRIVQYTYPTLVLEIHCGSGTYVRSLGRDIARLLHTGAVMSALTRSAVGVFHLDDADPPNGPYRLRPLTDAVTGIPTLVYDAASRQKLSHGIPVPAPPGWNATQTAILDESSRLLAVVRLDADGNLRSCVNLRTI